MDFPGARFGIRFDNEHVVNDSRVFDTDGELPARIEGHLALSGYTPIFAFAAIAFVSGAKFFEMMKSQ